MNIKTLKAVPDTGYPDIGPLGKINIISGDMALTAPYPQVTRRCDIWQPSNHRHYTEYPEIINSMTGEQLIIFTQSYEFIVAVVNAFPNEDIRFFRLVTIDNQIEATAYTNETLRDSIKDGWELR